MKRYGHIKISRKTFDTTDGDSWWQEPRVFSRWEAWVYLIQLAQWQPKTFQTQRYGTIPLARGEFVASLRDLAGRFGWSTKKTANFLQTARNWQRLKSQREIQAGTVYLIENYDTYQIHSPAEETPQDIPEGTARTHRGHSKETPRKQEQNSKSIKQLTTTSYSADFELIWKALPKRSGSNNKQAAHRQYEARLTEGVAFEVMHDGVLRYTAWAQGTGKVGTELVMMGSTFLGRDRRFEEAWELPGSQIIGAGNNESEIVEFIESLRGGR